MNNFKRQHTYSVNAKWIFLLPLESHRMRTASGSYMPDSNYHYNGHEASVTHTSDLQSMLLYTPSLEATKSRERPLTYTGTDW